MDLAPPTPGAESLVAAGRTGLRLVKWLRYTSLLRPGKLAIICLLLSFGGHVVLPAVFLGGVARRAVTREVGVECVPAGSGGIAMACYPTSDGSGQHLASFEEDASGPEKAFTQFGYGFLTLAGFFLTLFVLSLILKAVDAGARETPTYAAWQADRALGVTAASVDVYRGVKSNYGKAKGDVKRFRKTRDKWKDRQSAAEAGREFDVLAAQKLPPPPPPIPEMPPPTIVAGNDPAAPLPAPAAYPGFDPYASDSELEQAGVLSPQQTAGRAAVTEDPYASPVERTAAVAHDHRAEQSAQEAANQAMTDRAETERAATGERWRVSNADVTDATAAFFAGQQNQLSALKKERAR